jgi:hypothetical protein
MKGNGDMKRLLLAPAVLFVAACSSAASTRLTTESPTSAPVVTDPAGYTDAQKTDLARENIDVVYCGEDPKPAWCKILHRVKGVPDLIVDGTRLFVATTAADSKASRKLGASMCADIASASFDDNAEPIGYRHVHVQSANPEVFIGDCDLP